jgi:hypothetical protein
MQGPQIGNADDPVLIAEFFRGGEAQLKQLSAVIDLGRTMIGSAPTANARGIDGLTEKRLEVLGYSLECRALSAEASHNRAGVDLIDTADPAHATLGNCCLSCM